MATPCITPNPDIAGIGVRLSVYIQASLNLLCALIFAKDGRISNYETTILTRTSANLFVTSCSILLAAFIQAGTIRFSVYHALIVLNLSWINVFSAVLYLIIGTVNWFLVDLTGIGCMVSREEGSDEDAESDTVLFPCIANLCGMGAFGIVVWSKISKFGDQQQCTPLTFLTVFQNDIPVTSSSLHRASLGIYSIAAIPFINICVIIFLGVTTAGILYLIFVCLHAIFPRRTPEVRNRFLLVMGVMIVASIEILFIADTELMIKRSAGFVKPGESQWSFGQTLAMVMVIIPLIDTAKAAYKSWNKPGRKVWLN